MNRRMDVKGEWNVQTTDHTLLARWYDQGDAAAFREITGRYAGMVYATARRILHDATEAEDVAQECFETLALRQRDMPQHLGAWLHRVATNRALKTLTSTQRREARELRVAAELPERTRGEWDDIYEHVDAAIDALPPELREAVVGHFLEGQSKVALARTLGVSRPTVHYRIDKGLEQARRALRARGIIASTAVFASAMAAESQGTVPASLGAALGKIAVAGAPMGAAASTLAAIETTITGSILMKKAIILVLAAIAVVGGIGVAVQRQSSPPPATAPTPLPGPLPQERRESPALEGVPPQEAATPEVRPASRTAIPPAAAPETPAQSTDTPPDAADAGQGDLAIAGRVVDTSQKPIGGAFIQILSSRASANTYTKEDGAFRLTGFAPGQYGGHVSGKGFSDDRFGAEAGDEDVLIVLQGRATVSGRVIDARTQSAVSRFNIASQDGIAHKVDPGLIRDQKDVDDPRGWFELSSVETGDSTLIVQAKGYATAFTPLQLENDDPVRDIVIALDPGRVVEGRVMDSAGNPVSGAWLFSGPPPPIAELKRAAEMPEERVRRVLDNTTAGASDQDGGFSIDTMEGNEEALYAFHPKSGSGKTPLAWKGDTPLRGVEIVLQNSVGTVDLLVTVDGKAADGSAVFASAKGGQGATYQRGTTGADGRATLTDLPEGIIGITAVYPGQQQYTRRIVVDVAIKPGATASASIDFAAATAAIEGQVTMGDQVPFGGRLGLSIRNGDRVESYMGEFSNQGAFTFENVVPGEATLQVHATFEGTSRTRSVPLTIAEGERQRVDVDLSGGGNIEGVVAGVPASNHATVVVAQGEHAITEISLAAFSELQQSIAGSSLVDADGAYRIEGVATGHYTLLVLVTKTRGPDAFDDARFAITALDVADGKTAAMDFDMSE